MNQEKKTGAATRATVAAAQRFGREMLKSNRVHPDAFAVRPERRRRLRKGIRDEQVCLSPDLVELVLLRLVDSSVKHVLLMGMLNTGMRAMLRESRALWILMLKR